MKNKTFIKIWVAILIIGTLATLAHMGYALYAYKQSSIIHYIAEEKW